MTIARLMTLAFGLMACAVAPAWAQGPTAGVEAGFSMSRISPDAPDVPLSRGPGLLAGVYAQMPMFSTIGLQVELVYAQKATHLTSTTDQRIDYVEVPILAKLKLIKKLYLTEGVAIGFPVRARITSSSGADRDIKDQVTTPDIGLVIGGGLPFKKFAVEGRYEGGFKTVFTLPDAFQRNRSLSLLARYHF